MAVTLVVGKSSLELSPDMTPEVMNEYVELLQLEQRLAEEPEESFMVITLSKGTKQLAFAWDPEAQDPQVLHRAVALLHKLY